MKLAKIKKYIFYLTVLMPFILVFFNVIYYSFTHQVLNQVPDSLGYELFANTFLWCCDSITPNFLNLSELFENLFFISDIWGECLVSYFSYFIGIVLYNVLINMILFFVYIFESWVNKLEKDF